MKKDTRSLIPCLTANNTDMMAGARMRNRPEHEGHKMNDISKSIIGFDALYESMNRCKHGVLWKNSAAYYYLNGIEQTLKLERQLSEGTYKTKPPRRFEITHPKKREVVSVAFRDRVYQRSLNDNALYPAMSRSFIYENLACQKGKGTDLARSVLKQYLHSAYMKFGCDYYVLQCDIRGYYPNMRHDVAERIFKSKLPPEVYEMTESILRNQYDGDIGYNPGSQMIQIAGISILSPMDHFVKEQLHVKYYLRYMDDFILIHGNRSSLVKCKDELSKYLDRIGFELHPNKTKIYHIENGVKFLGFRFSVTNTGKVIMLVDPHNVKMERRKLRKLVRLCVDGKIGRRKVDQCFESWKAHASKGNSFHLIQKMNKYYKELWKNADCKQA